MSAMEDLATRSSTKAEGEVKGEKKPSRIKRLWGKLELDVGTVLMMFK